MVMITNISSFLKPQRVFTLVLLVLLLAGIVGCGQPKVAPENLRLTMSLRTAISAQNSEWLESNATLIEQRREAGEVDDQEYAAFQAILKQARAGQWATAERTVVKLQKAQRPRT